MESKAKLTDDGRRGYFNSFHATSYPDRFIWGGDLNTKLVMITRLMEQLYPRYTAAEGETSTAAQSAGLQVIFSHRVGFRHGDIAITYGLYSFQVDSNVGIRQGGASDAHDLVVAFVFCTVKRMPVVADATQAAGVSSSAA